MRLIDADRLSEAIYDNVPAPYEDASWAKENCLAEIEAAPAVDAVPLSELTALRDTLYDMDAITFRGLAKLNQLIAKYGGQGISNTILDERRWLETV